MQGTSIYQVFTNGTSFTVMYLTNDTFSDSVPCGYVPKWALHSGPYETLKEAQKVAAFYTGPWEQVPTTQA